ncbi:unnamed protein product [Durusdinium trenchii]|uniref:Uncharacterized protein n=1 Tax=Durusdinium trenchii TaxID=1381693 RepID=A0ABP0I3D0_9DINO
MYGPPWSPTCEKQCNLRPCLSFSEAAGAGSRSPRKGLIYGVLRLSGRIHVVEPSEHQVIFDNVRDRGDPQSKASINELMSVLGSVGPWMLLEDLARPPGRRVRAVSDEESTGCYGVLRPAPLVGRFCARQGGPSPSEVGLR